MPHVAYGKIDKGRDPYQPVLKICDRFVVTLDSVSMISKLMNTGKPVDVFDLPQSGLKLK